MSTGGKLGNQSREEQNGNAKEYKNNTLHQPPNFMGKSGMPDNSSTNRGKGGK